MTANPDTELANKQQQLLELLGNYGSVAVAFSGGVDSTLLLDLAFAALGPNCLAITAHSASFPERERVAARQFCAERGIRQLECVSEELEIEGFAQNPPNRCYLCKRELFTKMAAIASAQDIKVLAEGSNLDDEGDYRPGLKAIAELGVASPLREVGLGKAEIRELSRLRGLPTADKPSFACLASRLPYGAQISAELLTKIDRAEQLLINAGFGQVRVRVHAELARLELDQEGIERLWDPQLRSVIHSQLKDLGFKYVTLDLAGYQTGSMNATLPLSPLP